jgi:hypothetical protein
MEKYSQGIDIEGYIRRVEMEKRSRGIDMDRDR